MASVLYRRTRVVSYLPGFHVLVHRVARTSAFSAASAAASSASEPQLTTTSVIESFGPQNQGFQIPGNLHFTCHLEQLEEQQKIPVHEMIPDVLSALTINETHELTQPPLIDVSFGKDNPASSHNVRTAEAYLDKSSVEYAVQSCPVLLKKDLLCMFPDAPSDGMMVITVTQKTQNDMTSWSFEVEQEREQMLDKFVEGAKEICCALQSEGFWADFIEPSSGLPFFGPYTNSTLFETDDRYQHLGFHIDDLGCCRVIRHSLWGTHVFVGTIVTDAPPCSNIMKKLQGS
ncbi:metabolism of cobalamin associated Db isoform 2-T4 [Pholidichthys leucotaenia]